MNSLAASILAFLVILFFPFSKAKLLLEGTVEGTNNEANLKKIFYDVETFSFDLVPAKKEIPAYYAFIRFFARFIIKKRSLPLAMLYRNATNVQILGEHEFFKFLQSQELRIVNDMSQCEHYKLKELKQLFVQERANFLVTLGHQVTYFLQSIKKPSFPLELFLQKLFPGRTEHGMCNKDISSFYVFKEALLQMVYLRKLKSIHGFVEGIEMDIRRVFKYFLNFLMKSNNNILKNSCSCQTMPQDKVKSLLFNYFLPDIYLQLDMNPNNPVFDINTNKRERIDYLTSLNLKPPEEIIEYKASFPSIVEIIESYLDDLVTTDTLEYNNLHENSELTNENINKFLRAGFLKGQIDKEKGRYLFHAEWESLFRKYFPIIKMNRKVHYRMLQLQG